jgi:hypothetical protein
MTDRNWDAEMAKIDRQLASISDDQLVANKTAAAAPGGTPVRTTTGSGAPRADWGIVIRTTLVVLLGVAIPFWPYAARCGPGLAGYLGAVASLIVAAGWAAVAAWRTRSPRAHLLALTVLLWGMALAARDILPRTGYARETRTWICAAQDVQR